MINKYRVHELAKYKYSDIGKYVGEEYTNEPIRNDELVEILNSQDKRIKELEAELEKVLKTIQVYSLMEGLKKWKTINVINVNFLWLMI